DHLKPCGDQREQEDAADRESMRLEPAEILSQVLATLSARPAARGRRCAVALHGGATAVALRRDAALGLVVEALLAVILDEALVALARRARMIPFHTDGSPLA